MKVDLLCEAAAFGSVEDFGLATGGLDPQAHLAALQALTAAHETDAAYQRAHPFGTPLTLDAQDAIWRKEWLAAYTEDIAERSRATTVILGTLQV